MLNYITALEMNQYLEHEKAKPPRSLLNQKSSKRLILTFPESVSVMIFLHGKDLKELLT